MTITKYIAQETGPINVQMDDDSEWLKPAYSINTSALGYVTVWNQEGEVIDYLDRLEMGLTRDDTREVKHLNGDVHDCRWCNLRCYKPRRR